MRYFVRCAYKGSRFHGWQSQPGGVFTVQGEIERILSMLTRVNTDIVGCGRTDTGVHAKDYVFHFDAEISDLEKFLYKMNQVVDKDIVFYGIYPVNGEAHARYDAISRSYVYHLTRKRDPFRAETTFQFLRRSSINIEALNEVADLLKKYEDFEPFCKSGNDAFTRRCVIKECYWEQNGDDFTFFITANRFLRGMIRLIVGACINYAEGKITLEEIDLALQNQTRLKTDLSAPPQGLFLDKIKYEYL